MSQSIVDQMTVAERIAAPTPKFFRMLRRIAGALIIIGGALATGGAALPVLVPIATALGTAGSVGVAISSMTVDHEALSAMMGADEPVK